ncbi:MAG: acetate--CoA ligase family protein, partial [Geodermatophilaceae bacterium]
PQSSTFLFFRWKRQVCKRTSPAPGLGSGRGRALLVAAGVPCVATEPARSAAAAVAAADRLGYPVVCKVEHPELSHKSDVGGVRLGLADAAAVETAAAQLLALRPGASVLVQATGSGLEIVVGGLRDPAYGPVVMVGLGGVRVEVLGDGAFALAPVTAEYAGTMLRTLRGAAVLDGVRGAPAVDVAALATVVVAVGELIAGVPDIAEIDLNPVLAGPHGVLAVDWRILRTDGRLDEALG